MKRVFYEGMDGAYSFAFSIKEMRLICVALVRQMVMSNFEEEVEVLKDIYCTFHEVLDAKENEED